MQKSNIEKKTFKSVRSLLFPLMISLFAASCSKTVSLFPVEGPASKQVPLLVLSATVDGITSNSGGVTLVTETGEKCDGRWSSIAPQYSINGSLFTQYGTIVGINVAGIQPGKNRGQALLACSRGTKFEAEFVTGSGTASGYGIAKDSNGNIYKMIF